MLTAAPWANTVLRQMLWGIEPQISDQTEERTTTRETVGVGNE